uniref:Uncharacterized protein n=1 Tax=Candidatus Methanophaga sp. ANME-1 ERB7 TaxID=2759913 RepID=A0A7G9Z2N5_9EURY|nr:hypothetical protein LPKEAICH_00009 [Methanosarcinales archaeon ANME-1 ERB7]
MGISNRWLSGNGEVFEGYEEAEVITGGDRALQESGEGDYEDDLGAGGGG